MTVCRNRAVVPIHTAAVWYYIILCYINDLTIIIIIRYDIRVLYLGTRILYYITIQAGDSRFSHARCKFTDSCTFIYNII